MTQPQWRWGWLPPPPHGMPPKSPVHPISGLGWQAHVDPAAHLIAAVTLDGRVIRSPPLHYSIESHTPLHPSKLQLSFTQADGTILIAAADIISYHWPSHSLRLHTGVIDLLRAQFSSTLMAGVPFQVRLSNEVMYVGSFTTSPSSHSQPGVAVLLYNNRNVLTLDRGYPADRQFRETGPRWHPQILRALTQAGVLLL